MRVWREAFSRGGSVPCLLDDIGKSASVLHQENRIYNFGPWELSEYLTAKAGSSISAVLRDCIKPVTSLHGPLCHTYLCFHVSEGRLCGHLFSSHC